MARPSIKRNVVTVVAIAILTAFVGILYRHLDAYLIWCQREICTRDKGSVVPAKSHQQVFSTIKVDATTAFNRVISEKITDSRDLTQATSLPNATMRNVFYNRLGKCGSRSLLSLVHAHLAKSNGITATMSPNHWDEHPVDLLALKEMRKIAQLKPPTFYSRHIHYLDFQKHGFLPPVYINVIREPTSRFQSHFNYVKYGDGEGKVRDPPKSLSHINKCVMNEEAFCNDLIITQYYTNYFCGFDPVCNDSTSTERVELARKHIRDNYLVIGMTEEFEDTLRLLETIIPNIFGGAVKTWQGMKNSAARNKTRTQTKDILTEESVLKLQKVMHDDFLVYEEAKSKYQKLLRAYGIIH